MTPEHGRGEAVYVVCVSLVVLFFVGALFFLVASFSNSLNQGLNELRILGILGP